MYPTKVPKKLLKDGQNSETTSQMSPRMPVKYSQKYFQRIKDKFNQSKCYKVTSRWFWVTKATQIYDFR